MLSRTSSKILSSSSSEWSVPQTLGSVPQNGGQYQSNHSLVCIQAHHKIIEYSTGKRGKWEVYILALYSVYIHRYHWKNSKHSACYIVEAQYLLNKCMEVDSARLSQVPSTDCGNSKLLCFVWSHLEIS